MRRDRKWRRYQRERKITRLYKWMKDRNWCMLSHAPDPVEDQNETLLEIAKHRHSAPKLCSCWVCGNPRKHLGEPTLSEHKFTITCVEEFEQYEIRKDFNIRKNR